MSRQRVPISFDFRGGVDQATGDRHTRPGQLAEAVNVRQVKAGEFRKRFGWDKFSPTAPTETSAIWGASTTFEGPAQDIALGGQLIVRDANGENCSYTSQASAMRYKGRSPMVMPEVTGVAMPGPAGGGANLGILENPIALVADLNEVTLSLRRGNSSIPFDSVYYTVVDENGVLVRNGTLSMTGTSGTVHVVAMAATYVPSQNSVLIFYSIGGLDVYLTRLSLTNFAGSSALYQAVTVTAGAGTKAVTSIDCAHMPAGAEVVVAVMARAPGSPYGISVTVSLVDTATWLPDASPAPYVQQVAALNDADMCGGASILVGSGTGSHAGKVYVSFIRSNATGTGGVDCRLLEITLSTMALVSDTQMHTTTLGSVSGSSILAPAFSCGYVRNDSVREVYYQFDRALYVPYPAATVDMGATIRGRSFDGTTVRTNLADFTQGWLASKPCMVGDTWYIAIGYDDGQSRALQRTIFLRRLSDRGFVNASAPGENLGVLASQALVGQASAAWHGVTGPLDAATGSYVTGFGPPPLSLVTSTSKMLMGALRQAGTLQSLEAVALKWDTAATYSKPVTFEDKSIWPGGVPTLVGSRDAVRELSPLLFPRYIAGTTAAADISICCLYAFTDAAGRKYRSSPSPTRTATIGNSYIAPGLSHTLARLDGSTTAHGTARVEIEWYASVGGGPMMLQKVSSNQALVTADVWFDAATVKDGEVLYTEGGALSAAPPPPTRVVTIFKNRVFLTGTDENGDIWCSAEIEQGFGPRFNETLVSEWYDGANGITAACPVDGNYLAVFRRDAIGMLSGAGPDGAGRGGYVVQALAGSKGTTRPKATTTGPGGAYFVNDADDRVCLATPGLMAIDIGQGIEAYKDNGQVPLVAVHDPIERQILMMCAGSTLVLDYAHPLPDQPAGQWYQWTSTDYPTSIGAVFVPGDSVYWFESNPSEINWRKVAGVFTDNGNAILMKLKTTRLAPFGGMQLEGMVDSIMFYGKSPANTVRISTAVDGAAAVTASYSGALDQVLVKPAGAFRCREVEVTVEETASSGQGMIFSGLGMLVKPAGRLQNVNVAARVG